LSSLFEKKKVHRKVFGGGALEVHCSIFVDYFGIVELFGDIAKKYK